MRHSSFQIVAMTHARELLVAVWLALGLSLSAQAAEPSSTDAAKIEYLIVSIGALDQAQFIRNGTPHDATSAAAHLRRKLKAAGSRVRSAADFIDKCASSSSVTGKPYRIRFSDGREVDAKEFLNQKLAEYPAPTKPNTPSLEQVQPSWKS
jgi:hypothetical protein